MFRDAPLLATATAHGVIGSPYDPFPVVGDVAHAYDVRWFVAQRQVRGPAIEPQGLWDGGRAIDADGNRADWLSEQPAYDDGSVRIFEVVARRHP
jgi:hypothetical protein